MNRSKSLFRSRPQSMSAEQLSTPSSSNLRPRRLSLRKHPPSEPKTPRNSRSSEPKPPLSSRSSSTKTPHTCTTFPLSPFEKIKLESDRTTAHGHPLILPSQYGEFGPVFDVIALLHNAVKRQVIVAYDMLEAMIRYKYEVTHAEFLLFFDWFDTFEDVLLALLNIEEDLVYPFLQRNGVKLTDGLSADDRSARCALIYAGIQKITEKRDLFRYLPAGESVPRMNTLVNSVLEKIVEYYDLQCAKLPKLIFEADIDGDTEILLRVKFIGALRAKPNFSTTIPFLAHWLTERQLKSWKTNFLGTVGALRFDQWAKKFDVSHQAIPEKIYENLSVRRENPETEEGESTPSTSSLFGRRLKRNTNAI